MSYTEANFENAVIEVFRDTLGYNYVYAPDITRDYSDPLYSGELLTSLRRINPKLPDAALTDSLYKLRNIEGGTILQKNVQFIDYLQNGRVCELPRQRQVSGRARLSRGFSQHRTQRLHGS